jgi:hypothetical protein
MRGPVKKFRATVATVLALAAVQSPARADTGLVGHWHLDEGGGSVAADSSGNGNNGEVLGGIGWVAGRFGSALRFDPSGGRVQIPDNATLEPISAVSAAAWVNSPHDPGDFRYVVAKGAAGCIAGSYGVYTGPNGGLDFYVSNNHGTAYARSPLAGTQVWDGRWHMVVGTYDGRFIRLYVDGTEVGSGTSHTGPLEYSLRDSNDLFIGDYAGCVQHVFDGTIDEVSVWRRAISADEVKSMYRAASQAPIGPGGQTTPGTPQPAPSGPTGSNGPKSGSPAIVHLAVSPSRFALSRSHGQRPRHRVLGTTISYTDTQAAVSTLSMSLRHHGIFNGRRCTQPPRRKPRRHTRRCVFYVQVESLRHVDRAGQNSLRFLGLPRRLLPPGSYQLAVTPRVRGQVGRTVTVRFTVIA